MWGKRFTGYVEGGGLTNVCIGFRVFDSAAFKNATGMSSSRDAVPDFFQLTSWRSSVKFLSPIAAIRISKFFFRNKWKIGMVRSKSKNQFSKETEFKKENLQEKSFFFFFLIRKKKMNKILQKRPSSFFLWVPVDSPPPHFCFLKNWRETKLFCKSTSFLSGIFSFFSKNKNSFWPKKSSKTVRK